MNLMLVGRGEVPICLKQGAIACDQILKIICSDSGVDDDYAVCGCIVIELLNFMIGGILSSMIRFRLRGLLISLLHLS